MNDYLQGIEYKDGKLYFAPPGFGHDISSGAKYNTRKAGKVMPDNLTACGMEAIYAPEGRLAAVYDGNGVAITHYRAEYWLKDHLGNTRLAFSDENNDGRIAIEDDPATPQVNETEIMGESHYYPFGMNQEGPWYTEQSPPNQYLYNGKELNEDLGLNWIDYGARWNDPTTGRFLSIDRFSDKFAMQSPYAHAANNPISFIDVNGDSVWIATKNASLLYENGNLFNKDGSAYEGKIKGPLKKMVKALGKLVKSEYGGNLISTLSESENNFTIKYTNKGFSRFAPDIGKDKTAVLSNNAYALQVMDQGAKVINYLPFDNIGSGGDIIWNPSQGGFLGLGHEIGHAYDSNFGALDSREVDIYRGREEIREIRAVYHENRIRQDLGKPLRRSYAGGPRLIDRNKHPVNAIPPLLQKLIFTF